MKIEDWKRYKDELTVKVREAIEKFAIEYPSEEICYFALDSDPSYGYVLTCFNTTDSNCQFVKSSRSRNNEYVQRLFEEKDYETTMYTQIKSYSIPTFCNNPGDFKYQGYTQIDFPEWQEYTESSEYAEPDEFEDDYLYRNLAKIMWQVLHELAIGQYLRHLNCASPCFVGFGFHDDEMIVVDALNLT